MERISKCRSCKSRELRSVLSLGEMALTGIFPRPHEKVPTAPLELVLCEWCKLVQLAHKQDIRGMYGPGYGYRSSLNQSMVDHLKQIAAKLSGFVSIGPRSNDVILDIGSNDGTTLKEYTQFNPAVQWPLTRIGFDPSGEQFAQYYPEDITLVPDFFSAEKFMGVSGGRKAKIITSIAMFYDLPDPLEFACEVKACLEKNGIWFIEQAYLPRMFENNAFDVICHEHIEYYSMTSIHYILHAAGFDVIDFGFNDTNGGSFWIMAARSEDDIDPVSPGALEFVLEKEGINYVNEASTYKRFNEKIKQTKISIVSLLEHIAETGQSVMGYGASTKGNVLLQYCGIGPELLPCIGEINEDKFGHVTPGTQIPIVAEEWVRANNPSNLFVLPWHFKKGIVQREAKYLESGGRLIFPLPYVDVVEKR